MINKQNGFISKLAMVIIAIILIGGGGLVYARNVGLIDIFLTPQEKAQREYQRIAKLFPDTIGDYTIQIKNTRKVYVDASCDRIEDHPDTRNIAPAGEVCGKTVVAEYRQLGTKNVVFIHAIKFNQGKELYIEVINKLGKKEKLGGQDVVRVENSELGWYPVATFDYIIAQEGKVQTMPDGEGLSYEDVATGNNPVTQHFINTYPPKI